MAILFASHSPAHANGGPVDRTNRVERSGVARVVHGVFVMWVDARDMLCEAWVGYGNSLSSLYVFFSSFLSLYRSLYQS